jgi:PAS domain S-box-containing protein
MKASESFRNDQSTATESALRRAVDTTPAFIHTARPDGYLDYFNRGWLDFLGKSLEDVCGWCWTESVHPEDVAALVQKWHAALASGEPLEVEARVRRADGSYRAFLHRKLPLRDEHGNIVKWFGSSVDIEDRKCAEQKIAEETNKLERSEFYLREGERLAHMGSWSLRPDGIFDYWSPETFAIFGFDPAKGIPTLKGWLDVLHPTDGDRVHALIRKMFSEGVKGDIQYRVEHPEHGQKTMHSTGEPMFEDGEVARLIGNTLDITEQEELTQELRRREAYLAEAQRLSHTGSFGWDVSSGEIYWSDETFRIFELDQKTEITTELIVQRTHPDDRLAVQQVIERASRDRTEFALEHRLLMPDGSIKYVQVVGRPSADEGHRSEFVGAVTDITNHRRAEESLRKSEAYLADAQKLSQTGSWAWSPEVGIKYWSEECYRIQGFDPQDGLPQFEELFQRIHPDDQPKWKELMQREVREKVEFETDYRLVRPDGAVRDIHSTGHPVFSSTGDLIEYMGTVIDVTERKRAEALFAGEKRVLEMIATGVALNEILNALCLIIEEYRPGTLASILLLRSDGLHLDSVAGPSLPKAWREEMERLPIGPCAGSCGTAAYRGSPVMVSDIATDPLWEVPEHRAAALSHGLRASWSNPILSSDRKVLGTFCIYGRETRSPSAQDLGLIEKATHLARVAIERDRAETAVRTSEQKYRHLVDTTPAFVHTALPNGEVDFYNRGWLEYVGLPLADLLGWGWTCMIHPEDVEAIVPKWRAALEAGEPFVAESRVRRADGEYRWFLHREEPLRNEAGEIVKWYGSSIEIEERKTAEEKIRAQETELRQILDLTPQHIGVLAPDGSRLYANQTALEYFGITLEQWREPGRCTIHSLTRKIENTSLLKETSDFLRGSPMNSKLDC